MPNKDKGFPKEIVLSIESLDSGIKRELMIDIWNNGPVTGETLEKLNPDLEQDKLYETLNDISTAMVRKQVGETGRFNNHESTYEITEWGERFILNLFHSFYKPSDEHPLSN